jgi:hypothetical protein
VSEDATFRHDYMLVLGSAPIWLIHGIALNCANCLNHLERNYQVIVLVVDQVRHIAQALGAAIRCVVIKDVIETNGIVAN